MSALPDMTDLTLSGPLQSLMPVCLQMPCAPTRYPRKLKPKYALMNKVIHNMIGPKGKDKLPSKEEIQFLYEVMTRKIIDYALVIWCIMRDFLRSLTENSHIPFPTLVTNLVEASGIRGLVREKKSSS